MMAVGTARGRGRRATAGGGRDDGAGNSRSSAAAQSAALAARGASWCLAHATADSPPRPDGEVEGLWVRAAFPSMWVSELEATEKALAPRE